ncbi:exodeoxyribonuclease VII large subunit [uncultured Ruminococcus sp.]|uniref:exodeoxyribonuclease VII large subunit n=1 Tax=uncultured Ruminococcus sp. TaxID=165186 RepID=UPI0025D8508E|nr:exodeoxyribonuclease VII large subunit [uncultured Ruminococcus sp.]
MSSVITVSQLNRYIASKIRSDLKLKGVAVKGEISNFNIHYKSGHAYFTVKDSTSALKAVMFSSCVSRLKFVPEDGMSVLVMGNIEVYERDGVYQIIATEIAPLGVGDMHVQLEQTKKRLEKMGVFDLATKKKIPLVPKKIAVVTSLTAAALQDIIHVTERRYPVCSIEVYPAQVQGAAAAQTICKALSTADKSGADTIILARGGGSNEDLMVFNDESVALAVHACNTPVISAVGHETDTTLADYAADMRAPTPSAAAEIATPDKADILNAVSLLKQKLDRAMELKIDKAQSQVENCEKLIRLYSPTKRLEQSEKNVCDLEKRLNAIIERRLEKLSAQLDGYVNSLNMLSPFNVLGRGYAIVQKGDSVADSVSMLAEGDEVNIRLSDGSVAAKIMSVK